MTCLNRQPVVECSFASIPPLVPTPLNQIENCTSECETLRAKRSQTPAEQACIQNRLVFLFCYASNIAENYLDQLLIFSETFMTPYRHVRSVHLASKDSTTIETRAQRPYNSGNYETRILPQATAWRERLSASI